MRGPMLSLLAMGPRMREDDVVGISALFPSGRTMSP
jgi:hypothetical protein